MECKNLDLLEDEKLKIENAFNQIIKKYVKKDVFFKINKNDRHFVELVCKGYTLFAKYNRQYDDSIEGSYLEIGILNCVLIDGKKDVFSDDIIIATSKSYCFSFINNVGWIEEKEKKDFYISEDLVEYWMLKFFEGLN